MLHCSLPGRQALHQRNEMLAGISIWGAQHTGEPSVIWAMSDVKLRACGEESLVRRCVDEGADDCCVQAIAYAEPREQATARHARAWKVCFAYHDRAIRNVEASSSCSWLHVG